MSEQNKIDFAYNFKLYFNLIKKYQLLFWGGIITSLIIAVTQTADKFLFKIIIDRGTETVTGVLTKPAFVKILLIILIIFVAVLIVKVVSQWTYIHILNRLEANLIIDLKRKFFSHLLFLSYNFHTSHKTGSLISRLVRGGRAMEHLTDVLFFNFLSLTFQLIIVSSSLFYVDKTTAIVVAATTIVFVAYSFLIQHLQNTPSVIANKTEDIEKANISDIFTNIDSIKYFGKEEIIKDRFAELSQATRESWIVDTDFYRWIDAGQGLILGIGTLFLIYFPVVNFLHDKLSIGTLVFIYTIFGNLASSLFMFVHGIKNFYRSMADFESLFQYYKIENEIKDQPHAKVLNIEQGQIEFNNIIFQYNKQPLFQNFSLTVPPNKKVALVGHSGSGKSTLVKLLYRLYDVTNGEILLDGQNIKNFTQESLRSEMSIVPQECVLFDDTIYNNIAFSKPDAAIEEVFNAMKFAQLYDVVMTFPNKEQTIVGERGIKLSGGEKQRVSIARALLANKKILVLDEATSSLDSRTEYEIQLCLQKLMQNRTVIIIAHRLSTIMRADKIVVIQNGSIVQQGAHQELIDQDGEYQNLWNLQKGGYIGE